MRKLIFETLDWTGWFFCEAHFKFRLPTYRLGNWLYGYATDYGIIHGQLVRNPRRGSMYILARGHPDRKEAALRYQRIAEIEYEIAKAIYWHRKRTHLYAERQDHRTWLLERGQ